MSKKTVGVPFDDVLETMVQRDPELASGLLREAAECVLLGELGAARNLVRNVIKGSIGYEELSRRTGTSVPSLSRMFGPKGNPTVTNLANVFMHIQQHGKFKLGVTVEASSKPSSRKPAKCRAASRDVA